LQTGPEAIPSRKPADSAAYDSHAPPASPSVATARGQWGCSALDVGECCSMPAEPCHCWSCCEPKCNHGQIS